MKKCKLKQIQNCDDDEDDDDDGDADGDGDGGQYEPWWRWPSSNI